MYYQNIIEELKKVKGWISSTQLFELYQEKYGQSSRLNFNRALAKIRRRDDVDFFMNGRRYSYKYIK
jgi:hypothetical protein